MRQSKATAVILIPAFAWALWISEGAANMEDWLTRDDKDLLLPATSDNVPREELEKMRNDSRVFLPEPCQNLHAYSGFIPVDNNKNSTYLFFLHIKAQVGSEYKPLLLWMQGGPGKSALYGQFLENGPLGIDENGKLFRRKRSILWDFNVIYLDAPAGAGYSFDKAREYPKTLEEAATQTMRFMRRFLRIFPEYKNNLLFVAGESYGARSAIGFAQKVIKDRTRLDMKLKGVMLGVGFVLPLLEIIDSSDYLYYSGLLDGNGRNEFAGRFKVIDYMIQRQNFTTAAGLLSHTVLNMHPEGKKTMFEELTGFHSHGSIIRDRRPTKVKKYMEYANSEGFKRIIHVSSHRSLDATRARLAMTLALGDFFVDKTKTLADVVNNVHVLFYTAQLDAVFPAVNMEMSFMKVKWRGEESFKATARKPFHIEYDDRQVLLGYEKVVGTLMYCTVLGGGHLVSLDQPEMVHAMYGRFLRFTNQLPF